MLAFLVPLINLHQKSCLTKVYFKSVPGSPPKLRQFGFYKFSVYSEATLTYNMSYERKFYGLSEYVRFQKVRLFII